MNSVRPELLENLKPSLLSRLLDAVKQCQGHFGGKKELATDADSRVAGLLAQLEAVLCHGMKGSPSAFQALRNMTERMTSLSFDNADTENNFWNFVENHLSSLEKGRFTSLTNVNTSAGRGRAWLRASLNEKTLRRSLESMLGDQDLLERYYEPWAFMRDEELNATLPQIASGLTSILFAANINDGQLNSARDASQRLQDMRMRLFAKPRQSLLAKRVQRGQWSELRETAEEISEIIIEARKAPQPIVNVQNNRKAKTPTGKRKPLVNIVSFADRRMSETEGRSRVLEHPSQRLLSQTESEHMDSGRSVKDSTRTEESLDDIIDEGTDADDPGDHVFADAELLLGESSDLSDLPSLPTDPTRDQVFVPLINYEPSVSSDQNDEPSLHFSNSYEPGHNSDGKFSPSGTSASGDDVSVRSLQRKLDEQVDMISSLRQEIEFMRKRSQDSSGQLRQQLLASKGENDSLKSQLKSYVNAVQMLNLNEQGQGSSVDSGQGPSQSSESEQGLYEQKLIQVAEMHAELMEFNEHLQYELNRKSNVIRRLHSELVDLRGPMPDDVILEREHSISSTTEYEELITAPLINLWIPTAFMTGRGNDVHNVYQIYIRLRGTEWNVYKRYSEMLQLHQILRKRDAKISTFGFPPKKNVGNKDKKFVEERRKGLESYLRLTLNHVAQNFPEFSSVAVRKDSLISVIPILSDNPVSKKRRSLMK